MKKILYITILLTFLSCNGQDKKITNNKAKTPTPIKHTTMNTQNSYKNLINNNTEYFDIKYFNTHKDDAENLIYIDNLGNNINIFGDSENGYISNTTPKNSLFTIYKEYNSKGVIKQKWVNFRNGGGPVGIKYEFDDTGKLIKETDMDKNFKITPDDIFNYCKKNGIDLFSDYTIIDKNYNDNPMNRYIINYRGKYEEKSAARIIIVIDGANGEVQKVTAINGKHNDSVEVLYEKK